MNMQCQYWTRGYNKHDFDMFQISPQLELVFWWSGRWERCYSIYASFEKIQLW